LPRRARRAGAAAATAARLDDALYAGPQANQEQRAELLHHAACPAPVSLRTTASNPVAPALIAPAIRISNGHRLCEVGSIATPIRMRRPAALAR